MTSSPPQPRVAIVTGAGSGIGRHVALELARRGFTLVLAGRREPALRETASLSPATPSHILTIDLARPGAGADLVARALASVPRLDALVLNAAALACAPIDQHTPAMVREVFETNAIAPADAIAAAWPVFLRQRSGRIVNVSSMATVDPYEGFFAYAASKAAIEMLARVAAREGAPHGIRAFAVAPGAVETAMLRRIRTPEQVPPARALSPEAVAAVIAACAAGERDADSGTVIRLPSP